MIKKNIRAVLLAVCIAMTAPCTVFAADADQVTDMIELLPSDIKDMTEKDAEEIIHTMEEYEALPSAEKLKVSNYDKLYDLYKEADRNGYVKNVKTQEERDKERIAQEQENMEAETGTSVGALEYLFEISQTNPNLSIVIHYLTDLNGDKVGDTPSRIVLTSPDGTVTPIVNTNVALKDDTMDITLTWEKNFLQMDIAYASAGKWKITTAEPVTFSPMPYAGIKQTITSEEDKKQEDAEVPMEPGEEEEQKQGGGISFTLIFGFIALFVVLGYLIKNNAFSKGEQAEKKNDEKKEKEVEEAVPKRMTDEEVMEQLRREHLERKQREEQEDLDEEDDEDGYALLDEEGNDVTQHIDYDSIGMELEEYEEGNTGILKKSDLPAASDGSGTEGDSKEAEEVESYNEMSLFGEDFFGV